VGEGNGYIRLVIHFGELIKVVLKKRGGDKKHGLVRGQEWGLLCFWPLCVLGCISVVVMEGAYVRDCGLRLCTADTES
jgi:hypothetical protein